MFSDSIFEAINDILLAVENYSDYSHEYKKRTVLALAHLYLIQWSLDRLNGDMKSTFADARIFASNAFDESIRIGGLVTSEEENDDE
jgi:hypothetical protein